MHPTAMQQRIVILLLLSLVDLEVKLIVIAAYAVKRARKRNPTL